MSIVYGMFVGLIASVFLNVAVAMKGNELGIVHVLGNTKQITREGEEIAPPHGRRRGGNEQASRSKRNNHRENVLPPSRTGFLSAPVSLASAFLKRLKPSCKTRVKQETTVSVMPDPSGGLALQTVSSTAVERRRRRGCDTTTTRMTTIQPLPIPVDGEFTCLLTNLSIVELPEMKILIDSFIKLNLKANLFIFLTKEEVKQKMENWNKLADLSYTLHVAMKSQGNIWHNYTDGTKEIFTEVIYEMLSSHEKEINAIINQFTLEGELLHVAAAFSGMPVIEKLLALGASPVAKFPREKFLPWEMAKIHKRGSGIVSLLKEAAEKSEADR